MGLDLALGAVILFAAIRGWLRGFVSQAIRLSGFVGCFYLADPVRDQARPYVLARLPKVDPALMDRILWWASAVVSYVVVVGLATLAIKMMRRPDASGKPEARRDDQFAGFLFGAAKGALVAVFLTAGVQKYGLDAAKKSEWAGQADRELEGPRVEPEVSAGPQDLGIAAGAPVRRAHPEQRPEPDPRRGVRRRRGGGTAPRRRLATSAAARPPPLGQADPDPELDLDRDVAEDLERIKAERDARREADGLALTRP